MQAVSDKMKEQMEKRIGALERDYGAIRAGRANPGILDRVMVDYYGTSTPINQMAGIAVPDARTITIQPWDVSTLQDIEKAIQAADVGINPQNDGKMLRLVFPPLTEERRRELVKDIAKRGEEAKVAIRSARRDAMDKLKKMKKDGELTEDELKDGEKVLQDITDQYVKKAEIIAGDKEKEILSI